MIKYRLFDKRNNEMVDWESLKRHWYALETLEMKEDNNYSPLMVMLKFKDINDSEIYVSDVVRVSYYGKTKPFEDGKVLEVSGSNVGVVIETDMGFDVEFEDKKGHKTLLSTLLSTIDVEEKEFEVLGDIYDLNFSQPRKKWVI